MMMFVYRFLMDSGIFDRWLRIPTNHAAIRVRTGDHAFDTWIQYRLIPVLQAIPDAILYALMVGTMVLALILMAGEL